MNTIDKIAKFGAAVTSGYHRVLLRVGGHTNGTWTFTRNQMMQAVIDALNTNGIGFESPSDVTPFSAPTYGEFIFPIVAQNGQSDEQVRQLVLASIASIMYDPAVTIITGTVNNSTTDTNSSGQSWTEYLFGKSAFGQVAGVSTTTVIFLAVGIGALFLLKPSYIPRRLR